MEGLGYTEVYEIDNIANNSRGGFLGSDYSSALCGHRGYPNRFPLVWPGILPDDDIASTKEIHTDSETMDLPDDENDSVSWVDTGLPVTSKFPAGLIWDYMPK